MTTDEEERFIRIVGELKGKVIIVEGKKDLMALWGLGLEVIPINRRAPLDMLPFVEGREVVLLTDFDKEGRQLASRLKYLLSKYKIRVNSRLRSEMMMFRKTRVEDFRKLASSVRALKKEGDCYGETSANVNKVHNSRDDKSERCSGKAGCNWCDFWAN